MPNRPPADALVAIVTPVYNGARDLEAVVAAVQAQTYRPLVHCILDNASTDATAEILARYTQTGIPIITRRNAETIPFQANFNAVLDLMPPETAYFRMLHADDSLPPDAIEEMMKLTRAADDVIMVAGAERLNGVDRPHFFPADASVFEASNMLARIQSDEAHVPAVHVLYRRDAIRAGEPFYPLQTVECAQEAIQRTLSRGGRAGFVHKYNGDTARSADSGSLIQTLAPKVKAVIWEKLLFIEHYGPAALSNVEFERVRRRFLRVYYRRLLWWMATGRGDIASRDLKRLRERGHGPNLWDFIESIAVWPVYLVNKRMRGRLAARRWPQDAAKLG